MIFTSINLSLSVPGRFDVENLTLAGEPSSASATAWATRSSATISPTRSVA